MIGKTLSHYRILERLGEGAMGEVYLAEDRRLERPVAIKILRRSEGGETERHDRLLAEARAASALNHPNVAVVYEVDQVSIEGEQIAFLALEYVAGEPLDRWAAKRTRSLDEILDVALQIADALGAAHEHGFVHRDVKPSNLMVSESGRVKIVDFGVAAVSSEPIADLTTWSRPPANPAAPETEIAGTLLYMAPEQALGRPVDGRTDLYALGVVLYELATGAHPFRASTWAETLDLVLHREPPLLEPPAAGDPRWGELGRLLAALMAKERSARPTDAGVVAAALRAIRRGDPEIAAPALAPDGRETLAVLPFANLSGHSEDDWIGRGVAETIAAELGRLSAVRVIARERIEEAARHEAGSAGESDSARALRIGRAVGARRVVLGAVQRAGAHVRVTAQLVDSRSGASAESFKEDAPLDALFPLQDRLAAALAARLAASRVPHGASGEDTQVVAAYEAYTRGLLNLRAETYEGLDRALIYFERATALDPRYLKALVELGSARVQQADYLGAPELLERAFVPLRTALALEPAHARARREMGAALISAGRDEEGIAELRRALELSPEDSSILGGMGRALFIGRGDFAGAAGYLELAVERQPLAGWYWLQLAHCRTLTRDLAGARAAAEQAIDLQERFLSGREGQQIVGGYMRRAHVAALEGRHDDSLAALQQELAFLAQLDHILRSRILVELNLRIGLAHRALGNPARANAHFDAALDVFDKRVAMGADDAATRYYVAGLHAQRGERARALEELRTAISARPKLNRARARIEPELKPLADDAEFRALVEA